MENLTLWLPALLTVWGGLILGLISPGPSFLLITSASLDNPQSGRFMALGCGLGTASWAALTSFGVTAVLTLYPALLNIIQFCGGTYLLYLAYGAARAALRPKPKANEAGKKPAPSWRKSLIKGYLIHMTNPKAAMVWLALTSLAVKPNTPIDILMLLVGGSFLISLGWHMILALFFATGPIRRLYQHAARYISASFAVFFTFLGGRLLWGLIRN